MIGWIAKLFGGEAAAGATEKALELAGRFIEDPAKRAEFAVRILEAEAARDAAPTVPWVDALHKLGRQLLWFAVIGLYGWSWHTGRPIDLDALALLAAGPGVYTILKGRGR